MSSAEYLKSGGRTSNRTSSSPGGGSRSPRSPRSNGSRTTKSGDRTAKSVGRRASKHAKPETMVPAGLLKPNILTIRVQIGIGKRSKMLVSEIDDENSTMWDLKTSLAEYYSCKASR